MEFFPKPILYLDATDFDDDGNLSNSILPKDKPVFVMIQANYCSHCERAKVPYYKFAMNNLDSIICATIQGDSKIKEVVALKDKMKKIYPNFYGFPSYLVFYKNQKLIYDGGRSEGELQAYLNKLLSS